MAELPPMHAAERIALGLPWSLLEGTIAVLDKDGLVIINEHACAALTEDQTAMILKACNSYHIRDRLLDAACDYLKRAAAGGDYAPTAHEMNEWALKIQAEQEGGE